MIKHFLYLILFFITPILWGQNENVLSFTEYIGYVKKYHPIVKQANLVIDESQAKLMKARGAFDPKLDVDYAKKKFTDKEYYNKLNAAFKIPVWYGIDFKANYENNTGYYLNPESKVPKDGLYSLGVSVSLAKDLLINERMAILKQAKLYQKQAEADNQLLVNDVIYNASITYFNWLKTYQEKEIYASFLQNANTRLNNVKRSYELGDKPAIDTIEAKIILNKRKLDLEKASLNYIKSTLELSNYLWINDIPIELQNHILPDETLINKIDNTFDFDFLNVELNQNNHPKLQSLRYKAEGLSVERLLKKNNLLPKIDLYYNFLTESPETFDTYSINNYKTALTVSFPLFLRKERADLRLNKYKLQAIDLETKATALTLQNKLNSAQQELVSYTSQIEIAQEMVNDYKRLVRGEERKFEIGESSLFLINYREAKLIENQLKLIELKNALLKSKGKLFNILGRF